MKKLLLPLLIFVFALITIPIVIYFVNQQQELRSRAAPATSMTLSATPTTVNAGQSFTINVNIDTGSNVIVVGDIVLTYDATKIQATDITAGSFFTSPQVVGKDTATPGTIKASILSGSTSEAKSGIGTLAVATFTVKSGVAAGATTIGIGDKTIISALGTDQGTNVLVSKTPATITVGQSSSQTGNTTLSAQSSSTTVTQNQTFTVNVVINTNGDTITAADVFLTFEPAKIEAIDIAPGSFIPSAASTGKVVNNTSGRLNLSVLLPTGSQPVSGSGTLVTATFKAKADATGVTTIGFGTDTKVVASGGGNVLVGKTPFSFTVQAAATPTNTPIPTPTTGSGGSDTAVKALIVTYPSNGQTISTHTPTIQGTGKAGATLTVVISDTNPITQVVTINTNGDWSYSVTQTLADGQHTITLTEQATDGTTRTASSVFTIQQGAPPQSGDSTPFIILLITAGSLMFLGLPGMLRAFQR